MLEVCQFADIQGQLLEVVPREVEDSELLKLADGVGQLLELVPV